MFGGGALVEIHTDYLQRTYRRSMELIGEEGLIVWDYINRRVELYGHQVNQWQVFQEDINTDLNQMYVDQNAHFIRCIEEGTTPVGALESARRDLEVALAAKRSSTERAVVRLQAERP